MSDKKSWILLLVVLLVVVVAGFIFFSYQGGEDVTVGNSNTYQAVFLANSQVYFGKLSSMRGDFLKLTDIYYLQVSQRLQPLQDGAEAPAGQDISLVKLGGELHGPTDAMDINKDYVLLVEDLRADSNLVAAIEQYKANQAAAVEAPATQ